MGEWFSAGGEWIVFKQIQVPVSFPQKQTVVTVVGQLLRASILVFATASGIPPIKDETGLFFILSLQVVFACCISLTSSSSVQIVLPPFHQGCNPLGIQFLQHPCDVSTRHLMVGKYFPQSSHANYSSKQNTDP